MPTGTPGFPQPTNRSFIGVALEYQFAQASITLNQTPAVVTVTSTAGYPTSGTIPVYAALGTTPVTMTYTGLGGPGLTFTGCTIATGSLAVVSGTSIIGQEGNLRSSTSFIPVKTFTPSPKLGLYPDEGMRGSLLKTYGMVPGQLYSEYDVGGDVFIDTFPFLLASVLGGDVVDTGSGAPYTHVLALNNGGNGQPVPLSWNDYYAANNRIYPGARVSTLSIKFDASGLMEYTAKLLTWGPTASSKPTTSFSGIAPMPNWIASVTLAGTVTGRLQSGQIDFTREDAHAEPTMANTQNPFTTWTAGPLQVTGKAMFIMVDDTELNLYLNGAPTTLDLNFDQGASAGLQQLKIHGSNVQITTGNPNRGKSLVAIESDFEMMGNSTDAGASGGESPVKVTVQNAVAAGVYTA
jgi:hypothetical protein